MGLGQLGHPLWLLGLLRVMMMFKCQLRCLSWIHGCGLGGTAGQSFTNAHPGISKVGARRPGEMDQSASQLQRSHLSACVGCRGPTRLCAQDGSRYCVQVAHTPF